MANNGWQLPPQSGSNKKLEVPEDSWWNYGWAGSDDVAARYLGLKSGPIYYTQDEYDDVQYRAFNYDKQAAQLQEPGRMLSEMRPGEDARQERKDLTPGEMISGIIGAYAAKFSPLRAITEPLKGLTTTSLVDKEEDDNAFTKWMKDFGRSASTSFAQSAASTAGGLADIATGNIGMNQNYDIRGNRQSDYYDYGGAAQTIGSFADDIAIAMATFGAGNALTAGMKGAATVPTLFGRVIGPSATLSQRLVGAAAGAAPAYISTLPELAAGRMSVGEAAADVALGAAGGALSIGSWGGSRARNILSDIGVNTAVGAIQGLTPLIPGGREFSGQEYAQSLAYGTALGTAFGIAGAKPDPRVSPSVSLGRRFDPNAQPAYQTPTPTAAPSMGAETIRQAEEMAFGQSAIRPDMTTAEAVENTAQAKAASDVRTLRRNEDGSVSSLSDQILADQPIPEGVEPAVAQQAAEIERQVYTDTLMRMHDAATLAKALDLEVTGDVTPDILRGKIINEWLYQAKNGAGIAGVEQRLASLNLDSPLGPVARTGPETAQAGAPVAEAMAARGFTSGLAGVQPEVAAQIAAQQAVPQGQIGAGQGVSVYGPESQAGYRMAVNEAARAAAAQGAALVPGQVPAGAMAAAPPISPADLFAPTAESMRIGTLDQLSGAMAPERPATAPLPISDEAIAGLPIGDRLPTKSDLPAQAIAEATQSDAVPLKSGASEYTTPTAKVAMKEAAGATDENVEALASRFYNEINNLEGRRMMAYGVKNSSIIKTDTPYSEKLTALTRGEEVPLGLRSTGEVQRIVKFIGELDGGLDGTEVRRQITKEGRREFANGAIKVTEIEPNRFTARLNVDPVKFAEQTLRFAPEGEQAGLEVKAAKKRIELNQRRSLDDAYADINEVFTEEVSGYGKAKVEVESDDGYSTGAGALEPDEDGNIPTRGKNPLTVAYENWKMNIARTQQEVAKKAIDTFRKMGLPVDNVDPLHIEFWLMSKSGAPGYKEAGQLFVDRYVPESTGQFLDNYFEDAIISDAGLQQRYRTYTRINGSVPEKSVATAVKRRAEKIAKLFDTAGELAAKAGIDDPKQIVDYIRYQSIKKNMSLRSQIMSPEDAANVAEKLAKVVEDPEAVRMLQDINAVNKNLEGSGAWARILNKNFMNLGPNVKFELRNLPIIRTALTSGFLYGMDGYVERIEDDETYFGIPGSVLRKALGDGNAGTYALMGSMPYFRGGLKSAIKPGTRTGIRRMATAFKQAAQDRAEAVSESFARRSYGALPDADLRAAAEREAAMPGAAIDPDTGLKYEPGSSGYNAWIVNFMKMHRETHNPNFKAGDSKGTIGMIEQWTTDLNLLRAKIPFIKNMIGEPLDRMQVEQRKTAAEMKKFFDNEYAPVMRKYRDLNDDRIPKAMAAFDYRMTDLANAKGKISDDAYYSAKQAEEERIKNDYFMVDTPEGRQLDANAYADYVKVQQTFDALRTRHIAALIGFQEGVPYYEIAAQKQRLKADRGVTEQMFGAAEKQLKKLENDLTQFNDEMAQARASGAAKEDLVGYEARRRTLQQDVAEQRKITSDIEEQLTTLDNSITRLESVDDMAVRSQETGYILRHRDNVSQYVLRLSYDGDFKMPGVRREYASRFTANTALVDQARAFASEFQAKRVIDLTSKLADVEAKLEVDPDNVKLLEKQQRFTKALAQENAEGRKAFSDMTDIEVLDYLRSQNVRANVYRRGSNRAKVSAAAKRAITDALNAADKLEGVLVGRSNEDFTRAVKYVNEANRAGNQTLVEAGADGGVVTYDVQTKAGQQSFIDEIIDQINDMVDGTVDTDQLRDILERKLTYRETKTETTKLGKRTVEQIHIDMPALRAIVSRYLEPSIPNLSKRNNVAGYYDPDGNWTAKQHWDYITGSAEMMQGQIASYTVRSASRAILSNAIDTLRRYRVDNGLIEFISSYTTQDSMLSDIEDAVVRKAYAARRAYGITTLATNLSNAVMNRVFGSILSVSHQGMHAMTKYGVYQQLPDGKLSEVKWMDSQAEARAFMADKADKGEVGWQEARGTTFKNVGFRELGVAAGSLIAPKTTLRMLASRDPYWKAVYEESLRLNLQEGSAIGNYAMREEIEKGTGREKLVNLMTYMTRKIENANNWTSILNSAATAKMRMGITTQDFATLGTKQVSEAMQKVLRPSLDRMALHNKAGVELQAEIANLQERLKDESIPAAQKQHLESLIKQKQRYMSDQDLTPERAFMDSLMEYIVFDRQFEQGGWTKMDQSRIERTLNKNPAGVIAMTFAAPMFRSTSAYLAMLREMKNTHGTVPQKLARYAPVIVGGAALTLLGGIRANTTAVAPIAFMGDVAGLSEFLYDIFTTDDENKVTQASKRGMWESAGEYMAEQMGYDPQYGRDFVRAFFSEGLIRYVSDAAVSAESGVFDGLMMPGGQGMLTTGKNFFKTMMAYGDTDDFVGRLYNTTNMLPTSLKRGTQAVIQGAMGTKLDRLGNPVKEEFGRPEDIGAYKKFSIGDALRHAVAGKRWSEIRSTLYDMDGSFDVSTPEGAVRFANYLEGASGLKFGQGIRSRAGGPKEAFQMAQIERDAYFVQRRLRQNYDNKYADVIRSAKDELNAEINSGQTIRIGDQDVSLERALTLVGTGGNKTEQDLARKGGSTLSARQQMMKDIEHWGFIANTKQTIEETYGKNSVQVTDQLYGGAENDPIQYAKWKFMTRLQDAVASEKLRRQGRIYYNGYNTP